VKYYIVIERVTEEVWNMTVKERIISIRLLCKREDCADYFNELGLSGKTKVINSEASEREKHNEMTNGKGGEVIC
jgi:hypothetical protein